MQEKEDSAKVLLSRLFRQEYTKMTAALCRRFGLEYIEIAEDITSETFLKASEHWAANGIPANPTAWLYTVAQNKTKDYFKHRSVFDAQVKSELGKQQVQEEEYFEFENQYMADSQLSMIFAVCNPANSAEAQTCLALQILCGFTIEEIANAFLAKPETIKKRLLRARKNLRTDSFEIRVLSESNIKSRLETVLQTLYLLFNEGYFSKTNDQLIRKDLCSEAVRLTLMLRENPLTNIPKVNALLALMCFQSSRLDSRINDKGQAVVYEQQDRTTWDTSLIDRGNYYLVNAFDGNDISKYHLEAGIAYWHTIPHHEQKWQHILQLYDQLILTAPSPVIELNRIFVINKVYGSEKAIFETQKLNLADNSYYHSLLGHLYTQQNIEKAIFHYKTAVKLTKSKLEKQTILQEIEHLKAINKEEPN